MIIMLKKISPLISPELLKILAEMGHGDDIVLVDANYPAQSSKAAHIVRAPGIDATDLLDAILELFPVDTFVEKPIRLMEVAAVDSYHPEIWKDFEAICQKHGVSKDKWEFMERFDYYEMANHAYCVVSTGERHRYANISIKKGILEADE